MSNLKKAGFFLSATTDKEVKRMIQLIEKHIDQDDLIDNIDDVDVWEAVEFKFTCREFLNLIK